MGPRGPGYCWSAQRSRPRPRGRRLRLVLRWSVQRQLPVQVRRRHSHGRTSVADDHRDVRINGLRRRGTADWSLLRRLRQRRRLGSLPTPPVCLAGAMSRAQLRPIRQAAGRGRPQLSDQLCCGNAFDHAGKLTIAADDQTMQSGSSLPLLTTTMAGFVGGQTLATSDVTGQPGCATTATSSSQPGTYPIDCSVGTLVSTNYRFSFAPGVLTVMPTGAVTALCNVRGRLTIGSRQAVRIGTGCTVKGEIIVHTGGSLDITGAVIHAILVFAGGGSLRICGSHFDGDLVVNAASGPVVLGDQNNKCPSDTIDGDVALTSNRGSVVLHARPSSRGRRRSSTTSAARSSPTTLFAGG